jgi:hypothetical protein
MKLHDPAFERRFLALWRVARRDKRKIGRRAWRRFRTTPGWVSGAAVGFLAGAVLVTVRAHGWSRPGAESFAALALTGLLVLAAPLTRNSVLFPPELRPLLWLPVAEETIFRWAWRRFFRVWLAAAGFFLVFFTEVLLSHIPHALAHGPHLVFLLTLALLGAWPATAFLLLPIRWPIAKTFYLLGLLNACAIFSVPLAEPALRDFFNRSGPALNWLHPGGWLTGIWQAWSEPALQPYGWYLLLPLAALTASLSFSRRMHRASYQTGRMLEAGERLVEARAEAASPAPVTGEQEEHGSASRGSILLSDPLNQRARAAFLASWRAPDPPLASDAVGRWLERRLTPRERFLVAICKDVLPSLRKGEGSMPHYLRRWWNLWKYFALFFLILCMRSRLQFLPDEVLMMLFLGGPPLVLLVNVPFFSRQPVGTCARAALPLSYGEVARLRARLGRPFYALALLPCATLGGASAWLLNGPWYLGALVGANVVLLLYAISPLGTFLSFSKVSDDTTRWRLHSFITWPAVILMILTLCAGVVGLFTSIWPAWPGLLLLATLGTRAFVAWHRLVWARGWIDVGTP